MISVYWVKKRLLELLAARAQFQSVSVLFGPPESDGDLSGSDPLVRQSVTFDDPVGELVVDEMCGPLVQEYRESYTIDVVVQVLARTRDATFPFVEDRRARLVWDFVQTVQDATLGFTTADDDRFDQIYVHLEDVENVGGWLPGSSSNLAASRTHLTLAVEAKIANEP